MAKPCPQPESCVASAAGWRLVPRAPGAREGSVPPLCEGPRPPARAGSPPRPCRGVGARGGKGVASTLECSQARQGARVLWDPISHCSFTVFLNTARVSVLRRPGPWCRAAPAPAAPHSAFSHDPRPGCHVHRSELVASPNGLTGCNKRSTLTQDVHNRGAAYGDCPYSPPHFSIILKSLQKRLR